MDLKLVKSDKIVVSPLDQHYSIPVRFEYYVWPDSAVGVRRVGSHFGYDRDIMFFSVIVLIVAWTLIFKRWADYGY